jgi:hypothetical protein
MAKEGKGIRLVRSLEESRGCILQVAGRRSGFNGLSVCQGEVIRKIELKTVGNSDDWFAINGLYGIESLFFDTRYYLYFALIREQKILVAPGIAFLQSQIPGYKNDVGDDMKEWISLTKEIGNKSSLNIIPRVNFKLKLGIYSLVKLLENEQAANQWSAAVDSIWHLQEAGSWQRTYPL